MDKKSLTLEYKHNGCNCCQAVIAAYCDELGINLEAAKRLGAAFGLGMGNMQGDCGALCGAQIVLGLTSYNGFPIGSKARQLFTEFERRCGAVVCADLKGVNTGKMLCSCDDCVANAVEALESVK
ncbi:MAG: C_GCAxxG_C_C family protein [Ruminococcus sp.]|nr:C_GCAxxG_C_C family protein [Ruminococcus sp.]